VVRSASFLLTGVWNRIYRGVLVQHLDEAQGRGARARNGLRALHRSHMDYLLLSYLLYTHGMVPPHIAAGINLNLPVVGTLLRKGGAFFAAPQFPRQCAVRGGVPRIRGQLIAGGYSIEYFIEGGRSRTGRLLPPKGGMLSMTLRAFLRQPQRPVLFQPVYIGYEKLMEGTQLPGRAVRQVRSRRSRSGALLSGIPKVLAIQLRAASR
jgi:glycerol-3-phosphate O-acyltransferase